MKTTIKINCMLLLFSTLFLLIPTDALSQDAVKADPKHYSIEFENDEIRVLRIKYGPGEKSVTHSHPRGYAIFVTDYEVTFTTPSGEVIKASGKAGTTMWSEATQHNPTNIGNKSMEVLQIELKTKKIN